LLTILMVSFLALFALATRRDAYLDAALALVSEEGRVVGKAVATAVFLLATAPIGAHLIGRAAARSLDSAGDARRDGPPDGDAGD
ncbi:MAG: monovalent cation/H(+) antiporter subunit G, partial [Rubrimonas sp.]